MHLIKLILLLIFVIICFSSLLESLFHTFEWQHRYLLSIGLIYATTFIVSYVVYHIRWITIVLIDQFNSTINMYNATEPYIRREKRHRLSNGNLLPLFFLMGNSIRNQQQTYLSKYHQTLSNRLCMLFIRCCWLFSVGFSLSIYSDATSPAQKPYGDYSNWAWFFSHLLLRSMLHNDFGIVVIGMSCYTISFISTQWHCAYCIWMSDTHVKLDDGNSIFIVA